MTRNRTAKRALQTRHPIAGTEGPVTIDQIWDVMQNGQKSSLVTQRRVFEAFYPDEVPSHIEFLHHGLEIVRGNVEQQFDLTACETLEDARQQYGDVPEIIPADQMKL